MQKPTNIITFLAKSIIIRNKTRDIDLKNAVCRVHELESYIRSMHCVQCKRTDNYIKHIACKLCDDHFCEATRHFPYLNFDCANENLTMCLSGEIVCKKCVSDGLACYKCQTFDIKQCGKCCVCSRMVCTDCAYKTLHNFSVSPQIHLICSEMCFAELPILENNQSLGNSQSLENNPSEQKRLFLA